MPKLFRYDSQLKEYAHALRNNSSRAEIILWTGLRRKQLLGFRFNRQKMIANFIVDFYCKELQLAIEVDDQSHDVKSDYDKDRTEVLNKLHVCVIRFTNNEVINNPEGVLESIKQYIIKKYPPPTSVDPSAGGDEDH